VDLLPLAGQDSRERGDAAANRTRILDAARGLLEHCGVDELTMENVAGVAGVGKGTVFRRFESRAGLMAALVNDYEAQWQGAVITGPPPLGPGAPPLDRLLAFGSSRIALKLQHAPLFAAAGAVLHHNPAVYGFVVRHLQLLLDELDVEGDTAMLAEMLVAPMEIEMLRRQTEVDHITAERITAAWADLVRRVVASR
jgi:AcrR family transcriptional regulator